MSSSASWCPRVRWCPASWPAASSWSGCRTSSSTEDARAIAFYVRESASAAERIRVALHPWTSYLIIPLFAFANAGVPLNGALGALVSPVGLGVAAGLVIGKPLGIVALTLLGRRLGLGVLPTGMGGRHVLGVGLIAGVGFTVSLFVTGLAFADPVLQRQAKIAVLTASLVAAVIGALVLRATGATPADGAEETGSEETGSEETGSGEAAEPARAR